MHVRSLSPCLELRPTAVLDRRAFRLLLFRLLSFVRGERRTRGKISAWTRKAGIRGGKGTEKFIIGQRRAGHGIKLSYAHLRIFYYHRERRAHFPGSRLRAARERDAFLYFFLFLLSLVFALAGAWASSRFRAYFCIKLSALTLLSSDFICNFKRRSIYE